MTAEGDTTPQETGIQEAVRLAGGQRQLADSLGVSKQAVQQMVARGWAPANRAVEIEAQFGVDRKRLIDPSLVELLS